jgi:hypothetical protein
MGNESGSHGVHNSGGVGGATRLIGAQISQGTSKKCSAMSEHEKPRSHTVRQMMNFPVNMVFVEASADSLGPTFQNTCALSRPEGSWHLAAF